MCNVLCTIKTLVLLCVHGLCVCELGTHGCGNGGTNDFSQLTIVGDCNSNRDISKGYHVHCSGIQIDIDAWSAICVCPHTLIHTQLTKLVPENERLENY